MCGLNYWFISELFTRTFTFNEAIDWGSSRELSWLSGGIHLQPLARLQTSGGSVYRMLTSYWLTLSPLSKVCWKVLTLARKYFSPAALMKLREFSSCGGTTHFTVYQVLNTMLLFNLKSIVFIISSGLWACEGWISNIVNYKTASATISY